MVLVSPCGKLCPSACPAARKCHEDVTHCTKFALPYQCCDVKAFVFAMGNQNHKLIYHSVTQKTRTLDQKLEDSF